MRERSEMLYFRVTPKEKAFIEEKMHQLGIQNMSAYLRKMAIDGYCVNLDLSDVKETTRLLRTCSNNLNQYVKRANETGSIYAADIQDLRDRLDEIWENQRQFLKKLAGIR